MSDGFTHATNRLDWSHLGAAFRLARTLRRETQGELAERVGMDRKTISNYEAGRIPTTRNPPIPAGYFQVAEALGLASQDVGTFLNWGAHPSFFAELVGGLAVPSEGSEKIRRSVLEWGLNEAMARRDDAMEQLRGDTFAPVSQVNEARDKLVDALRLYPLVVKFSRICVELGADPRGRDALDELAEELLTAATKRTETMDSRSIRGLEREAENRGFFDTTDGETPGSQHEEDNGSSE